MDEREVRELQTDGEGENRQHAINFEVTRNTKNKGRHCKIYSLLRVDI